MILQTFYFICEKEGKIYTVIESLLTLLSPNRFDSYKLLFDARDSSHQSSQYDAFSSQARDYFPQALNAAFNFVWAKTLADKTGPEPSQRKTSIIFPFPIRYARWKCTARISWRNSVDEDGGVAQEYC